MRRLLLAVLMAGALSGCGSSPNTIKRVNVDGVDCIKMNTSAGGAAIDCNWDTAK